MIEQEILELKIDTGAWAGKKYSIPFGTLRTVGRERGADFVIEIDPTISRVHFEVDFNQKPPQLRDRGSSNGTALNGRKITKREPVRHGDTIKAGQTIFSIEMAPVIALDINENSHERSHFQDVIEPPPIQTPSRPSPVLGSYTSEPIQELNTDEIDLHQIPALSSPIESPKLPDNSTDRREGSGTPFVFVTAEDETRVNFSEPDSLPEGEPLWAGPFPPEMGWPSEPVEEPNYENTDDEAYPIGIDLTNFDSHKISPNADESRNIVVNSAHESKIRALDHTGLRRYRMHKGPEFAYPRFLKSLLEQGEFLVVAHFRKIGRAKPSELETIDLFPNGGQLDGLLPVAVLGDSWARFANERIASELVANDAIVTLFGRDCRSLARILNRGGLPGFSVADGFLGWYWPSQLKLMLESSSDGSITNWFQNQSIGLVYPNNPESCVDCIMHGPSDYDLESLGFDRTRR